MERQVNASRNPYEDSGLSFTRPAAAPRPSAQPVTVTVQPRPLWDGAGTDTASTSLQGEPRDVTDADDTVPRGDSDKQSVAPSSESCSTPQAPPPGNTRPVCLADVEIPEADSLAGVRGQRALNGSDKESTQQKPSDDAEEFSPTVAHQGDAVAAPPGVKAPVEDTAPSPGERKVDHRGYPSRPAAPIRPAISILEDDEDESAKPKVLVTGDGLHGSASQKKLARVRNHLMSDSRGNVLSTVPRSTAGRYKSCSARDDALRIVDPHAVKLSGQQRVPGGHPWRNAARGSSHLLLNKPLAPSQEELSRPGPPTRWELMRSLAEPESSENELVLPAQTKVPERHSKRDARDKPAGFATLVKLKRFNMKLRERIVTYKGFSKSEEHHQLLVDHADRTAVEVPLSLKMTIHEEAFHIVQNLARAYQRTLSKDHHLTVEAAEHLEEMAARREGYSHM